MKLATSIALVCLSGCSWFGHRSPPPPPSTELIVSGAPGDALLSIDGTRAAQPGRGGPVMIPVQPGDHMLEVSVGDRVVYREDIYVAAGEHQRIRVLSGASPRT